MSDVRQAPPDDPAGRTKPNHIVTVRVPRELLARLDAFAADTQLGRASAVRAVLSVHLPLLSEPQESTQ